jgi:hypothetical protein
MDLTIPGTYTISATGTNPPSLSGFDITYPSQYGVYVTSACGGGGGSGGFGGGGGGSSGRYFSGHVRLTTSNSTIVIGNGGNGGNWVLGFGVSGDDGSPTTFVNYYGNNVTVHGGGGGVGVSGGGTGGSMTGLNPSYYTGGSPNTNGKTLNIGPGSVTFGGGGGGYAKNNGGMGAVYSSGGIYILYGGGGG